MKEIKIKNKIIGEKHPAFIIAEAGVNHNGDIQQAKSLVDVAVDAGVDAVKFQTFKTEGIVTKNADTAFYAKSNLGKNIKQIDMIKKYELPYKDFIEIKKYCDKKSIIFLSTPHSFDAIDFLDKLIPAYKIGSGDITNHPALKHTAKKGKPIILGTGMSTMVEIQAAINTIKQAGNNQIVTLHCTTNYPCPLDEVNLNAMVTMRKSLDCLVGYSDHTMSLTVPIIARSLGAVIIEKHFTIDRGLTGPDHKASLEPSELKKMVEDIRIAEKTLGDFEKKPTSSEKDFMNLIRKSIVAKHDISKGETICLDMIEIKRPGTGLTPVYFEEVIGKKAKQDILKDEVFQKDMVE